MHLHLDFETFSGVNIKKAGMYRYIADDSFEPLCLMWALDNGPVQEWYPWHETNPVTELLEDPDVIITAANAEFEMRIFDREYRRFNLSDPPRPSRYLCVLQLGRICGYPGKLDSLAKALGLPFKKDPAGTRLITKLTQYRKPTKNNPDVRWYPDTAPQDFKRFYNYCRQDVKVERAAFQRLPFKQLSPYEKVVVCHMYEQNKRGLPVDAQAVRSIKEKLDRFKHIREIQLQRVTDNRVMTGKQTQKMLQFCHSYGERIPNVQKQTVIEWLDKPNLDPTVKKVLLLRQDLAHSSTGKFEKLLHMLEDDDRIRGCLMYYGGHTGRFGGSGFQPHNLPRAQFDDPDSVILDFIQLEPVDLIKKYGNLNEAAMKLVRPMIATRGNLFHVGDYKSIENVVLHWAANDKKTTQEFRDGLDQYKTYACDRFNTTYDEVTSYQRTYSKPCVLGLGYGGGHAALQRVATGYGVSLSPGEAEFDVHFYRKKYYKIPKFWRRVNSKAIKAMLYAGPQILKTGTLRLVFIRYGSYLYIVLPSKRRLVYVQPELRQGKYDNLELTYMGVDPYTKQWVRQSTFGGKLVENIVQAIARDLLVHGLLSAERAGYNIIFSVHDEGVAEQPKDRINYIPFLDALCTKPKWAESIPVQADGYTGRRYKKD